MGNLNFFSPVEIRQIQISQLQKNLEYAYQRSPYYRDLMDRERIRPGHIRSLEDLRQFPTTTKDDLSREGDRFLCVRPDEIVDIMTTSGTTGLPIFVKATAADMARLAYNEELSFRAAGIERQDVVAVAVAMDRCFMAGMAYYLGLSRIGSAVLRVGPTSPAMLLKFMERSGVTAIISVPSFLKKVAAYAEQEGMDLSQSRVQRLICIGEPVRNRDFTLNALGQRISQAWKARVFSTYAASEIATTFCECEQGCGGHLHPELIHLEIIDPLGNPVPSGETGEICVTPFGIKGMPLIRYRTGDYSFIQPDVCTCGRASLRLGPILGRRDQMLKIKGTTIFPAIIHEIIQAEPLVRNHVLVVESEDALSDKIMLLIETDQPLVMESLREKVRSELKVAPQIRLASAEEIQTLQTAGEYRKRRLFVDHRRPL
jgi:phenylacetate-CoA ligase